MDKEVIEEIGKILAEAVNSKLPNFTIGIIITISIAVVYFIFLIVFQFRLKHSEIYIASEIDKKRSSRYIIEELFNELKYIQTLSNDSLKKEQVAELIRSCRNKIKLNEIKITDTIIRYMNSLLDLFSSSNVDATERKREQENELFGKIKKEYEKL